MYEELLLESGLAKNEIKVYLALLALGQSQSGRLVKESGISSGKIYETLNKLVDKGLIGVTVENGIKQFQTTNPESILMYMQERREKISTQISKLEKIIPELKKLKKFEERVEGVFFIRGFRGVKPLVYELLSTTKGEFKIMGVRSSKDRRFNIFWSHWHRERVKNGRKAQLLFADRNTEYWNFFKRIKLTEVRSITSLSPSAIMVIGQHSFIFSYKEELTCIHIISPEITYSFSSFFDSLWKIAQP